MLTVMVNTTILFLVLTQISICKRTFTAILHKFNLFKNLEKETQAIQTVKALGLIGGSLCPGVAGSSSKCVSLGNAVLVQGASNSSTTGTVKTDIVMKIQKRSE